MSALEVPEEAIEEARQAFASWVGRPGPMPDSAGLYYRRSAEVVLGAAAPLIVAAELQRLADEIGAAATLAHESAGENDTAALTAVADLSIAARLRSRASVLRGEGDPK